MHRAAILIPLMFICLQVVGQFPPPVGYEGTTAMYKDSSAFVGWASTCIASRGYINISDTTVIYAGSNRATYGHYYFTTGPSDGYIMSLGDGGTATLYFDTAIVNGPGADFAVFENSFSDDFLELAFVEASSDGNRFVRFPSVSLNSETVQIAPFGTMDARKINNLAGKYRGFYGTPFDLEDLKDSSGIDLQNIIRVRIVDVVGCIENPWCTYDSQGHRVNDPWPTAFDTGGFDLDAVGVIHNTSTSAGTLPGLTTMKMFPNPVSDVLHLRFTDQIPCRICLLDYTGRSLMSLEGKVSELNLISLDAGLYLLKMEFSDGRILEKKIVKN